MRLYLMTALYRIPSAGVNARFPEFVFLFACSRRGFCDMLFLNGEGKAYELSQQDLLLHGAPGSGALGGAEGGDAPAVPSTAEVHMAERTPAAVPETLPRLAGPGVADALRLPACRNVYPTHPGPEIRVRVWRVACAVRDVLRDEVPFAAQANQPLARLFAHGVDAGAAPLAPAPLVYVGRRAHRSGKDPELDCC